MRRLVLCGYLGDVFLVRKNNCSKFRVEGVASCESGRRLERNSGASIFSSDSISYVCCPVECFLLAQN